MPSNFFGHLKRALELFISVRMSPLATRIRNLPSGKKYKIQHFCRSELETSTVGFSDTLNLMV